MNDLGRYGHLLRLRKRLLHPPELVVKGQQSVIDLSLVALLCSRDTPGDVDVKALDQSAAWRDEGRCVISGFHSPLERQCLDLLLRGKQPVVMALARGLGVLRLPGAQRKALEDGRLTIVSPFPASETRTTANLAYQRNRFVAALANEVVFAYIAPGGNLSRLADEVTSWGGVYRQLHDGNQSG